MALGAGVGVVAAGLVARGPRALVLATTVVFTAHTLSGADCSGSNPLTVLTASPTARAVIVGLGIAVLVSLAAVACGLIPRAGGWHILAAVVCATAVADSAAGLVVMIIPPPLLVAGAMIVPLVAAVTGEGAFTDVTAKFVTGVAVVSAGFTLLAAGSFGCPGSGLRVTSLVVGSVLVTRIGRASVGSR